MLRCSRMSPTDFSDPPLGGPTRCERSCDRLCVPHEDRFKNNARALQTFPTGRRTLGREVGPSFSPSATPSSSPPCPAVCCTRAQVDRLPSRRRQRSDPLRWLPAGRHHEEHAVPRDPGSGDDPRATTHRVRVSRITPGREAHTHALIMPAEHVTDADGSVVATAMSEALAVCLHHASPQRCLLSPLSIHTHTMKVPSSRFASSCWLALDKLATQLLKPYVW